MNSLRIEQALREACDTRRVLIGSAVLPTVADFFRQTFGDRAALIIADRVTYEVAGREVMARFQGAGHPVAEPFVFPEFPLPADYDHVAELRAVLRLSDAIPVAVGSGTINDLTKLAAHECGRPYMVVASAPSMDGYVSFGAPLSRAGFKQSFACPAPVALLADLDILSAAPPAMVASGYGDLLGKVTAGADWILADALGIEPIIPGAWALVQPGLRERIGDPEGLRQGNRAATEQLIEGLVLSGLAMQASRSSRPASGSEHQFSHLWEMEGLSNHRGAPVSHGFVSHGFNVGIGSLAIAAFYDSLLDRDLTQLPVAALCAQWPSREALEERVRSAHRISVVADKAVEMSLAKHISPEQLADRLDRVQTRWPALREQLRKQLIPARAMRNLLHTAGCPIDPAGIGMSPAALSESYNKARQIRTRYTVLDLGVETGFFDATIRSLFEPDGFWASPRQQTSQTATPPPFTASETSQAARLRT